MKTKLFFMVAVSAALLAGGCATNQSASPSVEGGNVAKVISGPGGNDSLAISYNNTVGGRYTESWTPPTGIKENLSTLAKVTIGRDGRVLTAQVTKPSGNKEMDDSVMAALDKINFLQAFPPGTSDLQRSFTIKFQFSAK